jgi:hypothetical protein
MKNDIEIELLICPSCGGQMSLDEFKPGDKIAKCNYCGKVIDLPDTDDKDFKSTTTETESIEQGENYYRKTTTRVTRSVSSSTDFNQFEDLFTNQFHLSSSDINIFPKGIQIEPENMDKLFKDFPKTKKSFLHRLFKIK